MAYARHKDLLLGEPADVVLVGICIQIEGAATTTVSDGGAAQPQAIDAPESVLPRLSDFCVVLALEIQSSCGSCKSWQNHDDGDGQKRPP
jgi:hypothetical protein